MAGDRGYARFFAGFCLFVVSMSCLVMGDNLLMLYLGWEGVGLCSYLLIGYYYTKPSAVAAAKKAFIVNRIGDLGLALGVCSDLHDLRHGRVRDALRPQRRRVARRGRRRQRGDGWVTWGIPCLFMLGAFGKSAQFPLYVWLPDAMEGPTPVSALIHAATMVTAGVYLIARMVPVFAGLDQNT
jgi:NADH-quinone oxidoreductase subunit L